MSTPRTDAKISEWLSDESICCAEVNGPIHELAKQLETELAAANKRAEKAEALAKDQGRKAVELFDEALKMQRALGGKGDELAALESEADHLRKELASARNTDNIRIKADLKAAREALGLREKEVKALCKIFNRDGATAIMGERYRQTMQEGWTHDHDDQHTEGELALAATAYLRVDRGGLSYCNFWPWDNSWWKPSHNQKRNLEKAGALIAAEWDRLDRAEQAAARQSQEGAPKP